MANLALFLACICIICLIPVPIEPAPTTDGDYIIIHAIPVPASGFPANPEPDSDEFELEKEIEVPEPECKQDGCYMRRNGLSFVCCKYYPNRGIYLKQYESPPCPHPDCLQSSENMDPDATIEQDDYEDENGYIMLGPELEFSTEEYEDRENSTEEEIQMD